MPLVSSNPCVDIARVADCPLLKDWAARVQPGLQIQKIDVQSCDFFGSRVGFLKIATEASVNGLPVPGIAFLRGGSVGILLVVSAGASAERYAVLTKQARLPIGSPAFLEIPAGMLDSEGDLRGVAAKELEEEIGLTIAASELLDLTALAHGEASPGVFPSPGGCDEAIRLFFLERVLPAEKIEALRGRLTGCGPHERITVQLVPLRDLWRSTQDAKALCALALLEALGGAAALPARVAAAATATAADSAAARRG